MTASLVMGAAQKKLNHYTVRRMPGMHSPRGAMGCQGAEFGPLGRQRSDFMFDC